eukprot:Gb_05745 [translate_table: standard]
MTLVFGKLVLGLEQGGPPKLGAPIWELKLGVGFSHKGFWLLPFGDIEVFGPKLGVWVPQSATAAYVEVWHVRCASIVVSALVIVLRMTGLGVVLRSLIAIHRGLMH